MGRLSEFLTNRPRWLFAFVALGLLLLPVAVWLDLNNLSHHNLERQATNLNGLLGTFRGYYAENVVARVNATDAETATLHNYHEVDGAIPIPATLSIELGQIITQDRRGVGYRFVSDYPFLNRETHDLTAFETEALRQFRAPENTREVLIEESGDLLDHRLTLATPVRLAEACVECHNTHPQSPKRDWKKGDVRGIQIVDVSQPIALNIASFKFLLAYLVIAGTLGFLFAANQLRLATRFRRMNDELAENNEFLATISLKISKYLSPQVYKSIFSGEKDTEISTERKKLTVFFSDIKDFTATTERLQPEELTGLLNEYFTEMSKIAETHGATIDKFIGDAIVAFFGDPTTKGTAEDARACVRMALDMQQRLSELEEVWRAKGLEHPFRARMGINTGYCNVGNFGSQERMDYTIIGAEANLAARLEGIAQPGGIVMSYETYAHVKDLVDAVPLEPKRFKGISREIIPYEVKSKPLNKETAVELQLSDGQKVDLDLEALTPAARAQLKAALDKD